ncbi:MAG: hypothetical protein WDZ94_05220 [Patescibacteria group bacterium]
MNKISLFSKTSIALTGMLATLATPVAAQVGTVEVGTGWAEDIGGIITFALNFIMVVALLLVFFYLIWGGIQWITSGGDKSKTEEARNKITAAVVGIIILAAAYALVQFVAYILGFGGLQEAIDGIGRIGG